MVAVSSRRARLAGLKGWCASIMLPALLLASTGDVGAAGKDARQIRAALTLNFIQFVEFQQVRDGTIDLCVLRREPDRQALAALNGYKISRNTIKVHAVSGTAASFRNCEIAYLGGSGIEPANLSREGLLTIGQGQRFVERGGVIGFVQFGRQTRFMMNYRVADRSAMKISSKLLRLAVRVID